MLSSRRSSGNTPRAPSLIAKKVPAQQRGAETYEHILAITAELLADAGIESLSTNMVCERAGLTPPALYRYFPNKYALLRELGLRLMQRQNDLIPCWITAEVLSGSVEDIEQAFAGLILDTYRITKRTPGGVWILRALRAVPMLEQVRLDSHAKVTGDQVKLLADAFPNVASKQRNLVGRVVVDMIYAAVELLFDVPLNNRAVAHVVAAMISGYIAPLRERP